LRPPAAVEGSGRAVRAGSDCRAAVRWRADGAQRAGVARRGDRTANLSRRAVRSFKRRDGRSASASRPAAPRKPTRPGIPAPTARAEENRIMEHSRALDEVSACCNAPRTRRGGAASAAPSSSANTWATGRRRRLSWRRSRNWAWSRSRPPSAAPHPRGGCPLHLLDGGRTPVRRDRGGAAVPLARGPKYAGGTPASAIRGSPSGAWWNGTNGVKR
jgi:hypothetical protein